MRSVFVTTVICAIIAVFLQIILAPNIAIAAAIPNFIFAYILVLSLVSSSNTSTLVFAFILGLVYDLLGHGPVGLMALLLVLVAFAVSRLYQAINNDTLFIPITVILASSLLLEIVYAGLLLSLGISASFVDAIAYHAIPCALYTSVFALVFYFLSLRFFPNAPKQKSSGLTRKAGSGIAAGQVQIHAPKTKKRHR